MREPLLNYWYLALSKPIGIEVRSNMSQEATRARLYAERRAAQDTDLDVLGIYRSPFDESRLWLARKKLKDAETS